MKRRDLNRKYVQSIKEVHPKCAVTNRCAKISICGGDDSRTDMEIVAFPVGDKRLRRPARIRLRKQTDGFLRFSSLPERVYLIEFGFFLELCRLTVGRSIPLWTSIVTAQVAAGVALRVQDYG